MARNQALVVKDQLIIMPFRITICKFLVGNMLGFCDANTQLKLKILITKPSQDPCNSVKSIERDSKKLTKKISRQEGWKGERGFTPVTPYLKLFVSSYRIKMPSIKPRPLSVTTRTGCPKWYWCASTFSLRLFLFLFLSMYIFLFLKEV